MATTLSKPIKKHRVLVIEDGSMLSNAVQLLLVLQETLEIVSTTVTDLEQIQAQIDELNPDAVVINEQFQQKYPLATLALFKRYPDLRVITFSQEGNKIHVVDKRELEVESFGDLMTAIVQ